MTELKRLGVTECDIDWHIGAAMQALFWTVVVKKAEPQGKAVKSQIQSSPIVMNSLK